MRTRDVIGLTVAAVIAAVTRAGAKPQRYPSKQVFGNRRSTPRTGPISGFPCDRQCARRGNSPGAEDQWHDRCPNRRLAHCHAGWFVATGSLEWGRRLYRRAFELFPPCMKSGIWPGYVEKPTAVELPAHAEYALADLEAEGAL
jgi:hypothetical protein